MFSSFFKKKLVCALTACVCSASSHGVVLLSAVMCSHGHPDALLAQAEAELLSCWTEEDPPTQRGGWWCCKIILRLSFYPCHNLL